MSKKHDLDGHSEGSGFSVELGPSAEHGPTRNAALEAMARRRRRGRQPVAVAVGGAGGAAERQQQHSPQELVAETPTVSKPAAPLTKKPHWIEVELVGEDGVLVGGIDYRIVCPDGSETTGKTSAAAPVRVDGLDPGICTITFPELDSAACEGPTAGAAPTDATRVAPLTANNDAAPASSTTPWIEVELVGEDGVLVGGVDYRIVCPDGSERTGTTSTRGPVRVDGIPEGTCTVSFPGLDAEAWDAA